MGGSFAYTRGLCVLFDRWRHASVSSETASVSKAHDPERSTQRGTERSGELFEEAHVSGVELADVGDAVQHHGDTLDAHAEGEAGDLFRVVGIVGGVELAALLGDGGEDRGIDHAAAEQLDPAGVLALAAACASAEDAADLHVGRGLGEGEEAGEEARLDGRAEERLHGVIERALEIGEGDVGVDAEAFDLMEDGRVRGVGGVVAMDLAGDDDADRRSLRDHGADLHGRGVGAHQQAVAGGTGLLACDLKRVLGIARGVVLRKVECLEVVEVALDLGAEVGGVAEMVEDPHDFVHGVQ